MGVVVGVASSSLALAATSYSRNNKSDHQDYYIGLNIAPTFYVSHSSGTSTIEPATSSYRVHGGVNKGTYTFEGAFWFNSSRPWSGAGDGATFLFGNAYYNVPLSRDLMVALGGGLGWLHGVNTPDGDDPDNHMAYQGIVGLDYLLKSDLSVDTSYHLIKWTRSDDDYAHAINFGMSYHF